MKRLNLFIIRSYIGPFVLTFFISLFLLLMQFLWKYIDDLIGKGLEFTVIAELLMYASSGLVPLALPLAILLSSIMTFGNMGEHYELIAIKSAGISLITIMRPLITFVFFISIGAFLFSNYVMPYTNLKMGTLLFDVRNQQPEMSIKEGVFSNDMEGYSMKVARKSKETNMLYELMIYDHTAKDGNKVVTISDSATMVMTGNNQFMILTMYGGTTYSEIKEKKKKRKDKSYPHRTERFTKQTVLLDMSGLGFERTDESMFKNHYQMLNLDQLEYTKDSLIEYQTKREGALKKNLEQGNYFKRLKKEVRDSIWYTYDTIPNYSLDMDSLFLTLIPSVKRASLDQAKNYARNTQSYISTSNKEFVHKRKFINRHLIEWHRKFTLPVSCILLFFIGAPLGAIIRKGGLGMPVVVSVLFFVLYYVITISGEKSARMGAWPAWFGMWLSAFILAPLGAFLTYKAATDSVILDIDTYIKPIKKALTFVGVKFKEDKGGDVRFREMDIETPEKE